MLRNFLTIIIIIIIIIPASKIHEVSFFIETINYLRPCFDRLFAYDFATT
jgi:hypothetical protein